MRRWFMTDKENDRQKQATLRALQTSVKVGKRFPNVEEIRIDYSICHRSAFGISTKNSCSTFNPDSKAFFIIPCINRECSSIGFDFENDIFEMYRNHQTEMVGEKRCEGQEAPDHPEQSCGGHLKYTIKIVYKQ